ncbi:ribosomal-processing cysteine protease Prp [Salinicoccus sp. CNSTN-B1]
MINVEFHINDDGQVTSFNMEGHAMFGEYGSDIVCAGASAVVFGSVNAILNMTDANPSIDMEEATGYFNFEVTDPDDEKLQTLLESMIISLKTIEEEYGENIKLSFK